MIRLGSAAAPWLVAGLLAAACATKLHAQRGRAALAAGDERLAEHELTLAVAATPDDPELWRDLARSRFRIASHAEAHDAIERALSLAPADADSLLLRAQIRVALGDHDAGLADALAALDSLDSAARAQEAAILLLRLHRPQEAMRAGRRSIELSAGDPAAYTNLAVLAVEAGDEEVARATFTSGRARHPHDPGLAQAYAAWLVTRGELAPAREVYRSLLADHPRPGLVHLALALLHHQDGELEPAERHALAAVAALGDERADVHYTLVVVLIDQGRREDALRQLARARRRFPGDESLAELAERLTVAAP